MLKFCEIFYSANFFNFYHAVLSNCCIIYKKFYIQKKLSLVKKLYSPKKWTKPRKLFLKASKEFSKEVIIFTIRLALIDFNNVRLLVIVLRDAQIFPTEFAERRQNYLTANFCQSAMRHRFVCKHQILWKNSLLILLKCQFLSDKLIDVGS